MIRSVLVLTLSLLVLPSTAGAQAIRPGELWLDTDGVHINAHGGGILFHEGTYYWFGEHKAADTNRAHVGVRVYTSTDLVTWTNAGVALAVEDDPMSEIAAGCVIERPKVLFNHRTGQFVMWFHLELIGHGYNAARAGVAVSDSPTGPFEYLGSVRPNPGRLPIGIDAELRKRVLNAPRNPEQPQPGETKRQTADRLFVRDVYGGQMARDMTLFLDDDGTAYHVFAAEDNLSLNIAELDDTFTRHTGRYARVLVGEHREAPALFKRGGRYHLITSGCTGWAPNAAQHHVAESIWGPWTATGNPCVGDEAELTFRSQSTFVLPIKGGPGAEDTFIFMADRWTPDTPIDGRYIRLPIEFEQDRPVLRFRASWRPGVLDASDAP